MDNSRIRNRLDDYKYNFLLNLQEYLDTKLLFFGSILRVDYFEGSSDIDIAVLSDNPISMVAKIKHYLHIHNSKLIKIYHTFNDDKDHSLIRGYKLTYKDDEHEWGFDITIYDDIYKKSILQEIYNTNHLPFYITWMMFFIKFLYYKLGLISYATYYDFKRRLFNLVMNKQSTTLGEFF